VLTCTFFLAVDYTQRISIATAGQGERGSVNLCGGLGQTSDSILQGPAGVGWLIFD
jgi:hypothetical protein